MARSRLGRRLLSHGRVLACHPQRPTDSGERQTRGGRLQVSTLDSTTARVRSSPLGGNRPLGGNCHRLSLGRSRLSPRIPYSTCCVHRPCPVRVRRCGAGRRLEAGIADRPCSSESSRARSLRFPISMSHTRSSASSSGTQRTERSGVDGLLGTSRVVHRSVTHSLVVGAIAAGVRSARRQRSHRSSASPFGPVRSAPSGSRRRCTRLGRPARRARDGAIRGERHPRRPLGRASVAALAVDGHPRRRCGASGRIRGGPRYRLTPDWLFRLAPRARVARRLVGPNAALAGRVRDRTRRDRVRTRDDLPAHRSVAPRVRRPPGRVGAAYGVAALAVTPPTLEVSYRFVFSILGVGLLCGVVRDTPRWRSRARPSPTPRRRTRSSSARLPHWQPLRSLWPRTRSSTSSSPT